ncbi:MAG: V-type ATP synthase subunit E [Eubacteriaceae bacterium]|jgi:V/A-type H+-transporting ATPase subunit E
MASDKIVNKILENAQAEAEAIQKSAKEQAAADTKKIETQTAARLESLKKQFEADKEETKRRGKLTAGLDERKDLLREKRRMLDKAFDLALQKMGELPEKEWAKLIREIVLAGTVTGTRMIKVPEKDMPRYTGNFMGKGPFLDQLNQMLKENGHQTGLELDPNPAGFREGIMLIGEDSDVNGSFEVLLQNARGPLEWDVTQILFNPEKPEV